MARSSLYFALLGSIALSHAQTSTNDGGPLATMTGGNAPGATITGPEAACATAGGLLEICAQQTPGFENLDFTSQASCLCYGWINTDAWEPSIYDQAFGTCASYYKTASPSIYSAATSQGTAPCKQAGNLASATTTDASGLAAFDTYLSSAMSADPGEFGSMGAAPTPTGGVQGGGSGGGSGSLFPTNAAGGGVQLTPGTASGSGPATGPGGTVMTTTGSGQQSTGSSKPSVVGGNDAAALKAGSGIAIGIFAAMIAL